MSAMRATSPWMATTRPRAPAPMALTAWSRPARPRATMATSAPDPANLVATARPTPLLPPVTTAARPARLISIPPSVGSCSDHGAQAGGQARAGQDGDDLWRDYLHS